MNANHRTAANSGMPTGTTTTSDITELDAVSLSRAIRTRDLSCAEILDAFLAQVTRLNPQVNALVALQSEETLRQQARHLDEELAQGHWRGPLHGLPQAPKDIMPVRGMLSTNGSPIYKDRVSTADAVVVERVRQGGAVFIGRSNSPEFGLGGHTYNKVYGTTGNAFNPGKTAGGSSGGAGVAVALRMLPVADGTDMMGSLRTPAAFNNIYGMRTTPGLVPHGPGEEVFFQQFSVTGPMARNIPDLAMLLSVQAGFDARLPLTRRGNMIDFNAPLKRDFKDVRVGWLGDMGGHLAMEPEVLALCEQSCRTFEAIGCRVEAVVPDFDLERLWRAWLTLRSFNIAGTNAALYNNAAQRALLKPEAVWEIERGLSLTGPDVFNAACDRSAWYQVLRGLFERYDYLILPATQAMPFDASLHWPAEVNGRAMDTYHRWMEVVVPATMAGLPALCVPAGFSASGLPAGLQILGPTQADWSVLQLGHAYDQASGHARVRSPLLS
jgi:amidase